MTFACIGGNAEVDIDSFGTAASRTLGAAGLVAAARYIYMAARAEIFSSKFSCCLVNSADIPSFSDILN